MLCGIAPRQFLGLDLGPKCALKRTKVTIRKSDGNRAARKWKLPRVATFQTPPDSMPRGRAFSFSLKKQNTTQKLLTLFKTLSFWLFLLDRLVRCSLFSSMIIWKFFVKFFSALPAVRVRVMCDRLLSDNFHKHLVTITFFAKQTFFVWEVQKEIQ